MSNNKTLNEKIDEIFNKLDRKHFLDEEFKNYAYLDRPLPIGHEQTISQPSLVVEMTKALDINKDNKVLEIGTGSGYQTAFLAEFASEVFTVERIEELSKKAQKRLKELGYENIHFKIGDGSEGWPEYSPYDRIMVTASAGKLPDKLLSQLKTGGKMVVPIGEETMQELFLIEKNKDDDIIKKSLGFVKFVKLHGQYSWGE
ncbi:MAG: Protein-L-isoaspartate(D-aspartate) O-methyltransferase [Clostridiales bacterium]|jgi:protein-L-isoaspartate(D-aspartate) O-methyltransferase|nr:Protein-L-isoaspartate(D-aspartate) O-methyltransferase [Clostridiales bacterium]